MAREQLRLPERVGIAAELAMRAGAYHGLWYPLASAESRGRHPEGLSLHWDALRFFQAGQLYALVLALTSLFEKRSDTINFRALAKSLDGTAAAEIDACDSLVTKVIRLRHNLFAHRSAHLGVAGVYRLASVTSDDLKELAEKALQIASLMCKEIRLPEPAAPTGAVVAADGLLAALQRDATGH